MSAERELDAFPDEAFDAAVLRELDDASRTAIKLAGRVRDVDADTVLYRDGDASESFYVVIEGAVELRAIRRGEEEATTLRTAHPRDTFGEESTLPGLSRRATAVAIEGTSVLEIPIAVFRRAMGRGGESREAEREKRYLHRAVTKDAVLASALGRGLGDESMDVLLDAAELRRIGRGLRVYEVGDLPEAFYLVAEGLIQIQREVDSHVSVLAYIARGDFFGDEELAYGDERHADAVAAGDTWCIRVPSRAFQFVADRNPKLLSGLRRVASEQRDRQSNLVGDVNSTQHVFGDLYRLKTARSLLVIDQDSCVRCGHCAWSCSEVHGTSRLVRRGDNMLVALAGDSNTSVPTTLSLPNTCQHCRNAACMVDCPTGAIGRDLRGEVFIREELCTGCGKCSKACPWENISMAPNPSAPTSEVAVKCDLCRGYESPACVQACPTESIFRIEPERDISEVRQLAGRDPRGTARSVGRIADVSLGVLLISALAAVSLSMMGIGHAMQRAGTWTPGSGVGLIAALGTGLCVILLLAYAIPKRMVWMWMRRRATRANALTGIGEDQHPAKSRIKPQLLMHAAIGLIACGTAAAHAGIRMPASPAGALNLAFWMATISGALGGALYFIVPKRLSRLERTSALPEDLRGRRRELLDRLFRESTGRGELVKAITKRVLVPYSRAPLGSLALLLSGRTLADERRHLRVRIDSMLESRGANRLEGLDGLIKTVVDLRAAPSRRYLTVALRGWLPIHIVAVVTCAVLLAVHIAMVVIW